MYVEYDAAKEGVSDQLTLDTPSRIKTLVITHANRRRTSWSRTMRSRATPSTFGLATNDFLLTGGDGYQALKAAAEAARNGLSWANARCSSTTSKVNWTAP